ncbi:outer membrane lipoprotein carrier protein LolA [Sphingomonas bacterium]|uniref:LolA family protein n=1 Tax=Sphingomonas bacterium TaxID=1895847 RepID=UPI002632C60C|nr:outer membrane lipoprotein carrier protein LolA [Sphingomonas bacterium]MDB5678183.1 cell envelope biosis protein LolA [Sphingomonas bacterium]
MTSRALALLSLPALIAAAPSTSPELAKVQAHLSAVQSMTAAFTQTDRNGKMLTGTLSLKRPGKIRFQYEKGVPILVVADGNSLWFLDYSVKQKQRWPIGGSPLGVLLDPSKDIGRFAKVVPTADPSILSVEANDPKHPEYGRITMIFEKNGSAPAGLMLIGWVALDAQNNRTTIRLSGQKFNVPISDGTFRFNDPAPAGPRK